MAFDGIVTRQVVKELQACLIDGKINKVYQPNKNEILLGIYANSKNYSLLINIDCANCRMHLTTTKKINPHVAPNFCMLLRKHLIGMKIKSIENYGLERIIKLNLEGYNELNDITYKTLVIELMGKHSNIILLNQNDIIIDSLRHTDITTSALRDILPAHKYSFPISDKIDFLKKETFEEFYKKILPYAQTESIDKVLSSYFTGISKLFIHYLCKDLKIPIQIASKEQYHTLYNALKEILNCNNLICIQFSDDKKQDYVIAKGNGLINFFLDDFYSEKEKNDEFLQYRNNLLKLILSELKKYTRRLSNIEQKLEECNQKEQYRIYGELITANLYKIDANENLDNLVLENYYEENKLTRIPLDKSVSVGMNAKKYFKKYNKLKSACEIVSKQKQDTKKEIDYIESVVYELENAKTISEIDSIYTEFSENFLGKNVSKTNTKKKTSLKKKEEPFEPMQFEIDGYVVLVRKK